MCYLQICERDMPAIEREKVIYGIHSCRLPWDFCAERSRQRGIGTLLFLQCCFFILREWSKYQCNGVALRLSKLLKTVECGQMKSR